MQPYRCQCRRSCYCFLFPLPLQLPAHPLLSSPHRTFNEEGSAQAEGLSEGPGGTELGEMQEMQNNHPLAIVGASPLPSHLRRLRKRGGAWQHGQHMPMWREAAPLGSLQEGDAACLAGCGSGEEGKESMAR